MTEKAVPVSLTQPHEASEWNETDHSERQVVR